jgi:hypothetical protein
MLTLILRVGEYELSGRESTGDIDAVVMPPTHGATYACLSLVIVVSGTPAKLLANR